MYYAHMQNADLIILDDPVSSFDNNKKYAILHRMSKDNAVASFVWNENGIVTERMINSEDDVCIITKEYANIARKSDINIVSRVAFLRKLCELNGRQGEWGEAYEILSCLVHVSGIRRKLTNDTYVDMDDTEIEKGMSKIKEFIPDFDFEKLKDSTYTISGIKALYKCENNAYLSY